MPESRSEEASQRTDASIKQNIIKNTVAFQIGVGNFPPGFVNKVTGNYFNGIFVTVAIGTYLFDNAQDLFHKTSPRTLDLLVTNK